MSGTIDEPVFSLDKDERKNDIKESVTMEKETVKSILKTEFNLFQRDTTVEEVQVDNKNEVEFIYYESDITAPEEDSTAIKKKQKRRLGKWIDGIKEEAEKDNDGISIESEK
jgi:hypothetical protein